MVNAQHPFRKHAVKKAWPRPYHRYRQHTSSTCRGGHNRPVPHLAVGNHVAANAATVIPYQRFRHVFHKPLGARSPRRPIGPDYYAGAQPAAVPTGVPRTPGTFPPQQSATPLGIGRSTAAAIAASMKSHPRMATSRRSWYFGITTRLSRPKR